MRYILPIAIVLFSFSNSDAQCCCCCQQAQQGGAYQEYSGGINGVGQYANVRQRIGNRIDVQVGLINIQQMAREAGGDIGQTATTGGSGAKKGPLRRLFGRRR